MPWLKQGRTKLKTSYWLNIVFIRIGNNRHNNSVKSEIRTFFLQTNYSFNHSSSKNTDSLNRENLFPLFFQNHIYLVIRHALEIKFRRGFWTNASFHDSLKSKLECYLAEFYSNPTIHTKLTSLTNLKRTFWGFVYLWF